MKTNNNLVLQPPNRRPSSWPAALMVAAFVGVLACSIARVQAETYAYTVYVSDPSDVAYSIAPPYFYSGYSTESGSIEPNSAGGYFWDVTNTEIMMLFTNIGFDSIRIGGNSADDSTNQNPSPEVINTFEAFLKAVNMNCIWTLDVATGLAETNGIIANEVSTIYGNGHKPGNVLWFDVGNEPEGYIGSGDTFPDNNVWLSAWKATVKYVIDDATTESVCGGPDSWNNGLTFMSSFFAPQLPSQDPIEFADTPYLTYHFSPISNADTKYMGDDTNFCYAILSSNLDWAGGATNFQRVDSSLTSDVYNNGNSYDNYIITEFNPFDGAGDKDGSLKGNNFGEGLYELDALNWFSHNGTYSNHAYGCKGIYSYSTGKHAAYYTDSNGDYYAYPLVYGTKAFQITRSGGSSAPGVVAETISNLKNLDVTSYATSCGNVVYITVINKGFGPGSHSATAIVGVHNSAWNGAAIYAMSLSTANNDVTNQTATLGGDTLDGLHAWNGTWTSLGTLNAGNNKYDGVAPGSATIFKIVEP